MEEFPIKARIALIDDDLSVRRAVKRLLRTHGYFCAAYESGEAALTDPQFSDMHCLIVDFHLRGMDGLEFCDRLDSLDIHIPHLFITSYMKSDLPDRLRDSILLPKPFEEDQLIDSIQRLISYN